jgi:hypothetical protein
MPSGIGSCRRHENSSRFVARGCVKNDKAIRPITVETHYREVAAVESCGFGNTTPSAAGNRISRLGFPGLRAALNWSDGS